MNPGQTLSTHALKSLDQFDVQKAEAAFTTSCGDECPLVWAKRRKEWQLPDSKELPPKQNREVRDMIEQKVKTLLAGLQFGYAPSRRVHASSRGPAGREGEV